MTAQSELLLATLALCLALSIQQSVLAVETRPGAIDKTAWIEAAQNSNSSNGSSIPNSNLFDGLGGPRPRIVGGKNALEGRYPYFVSLLNQVGQHACGGILVAPDIVMSAAHCANIKFAQVGRWSLKDELDGYEEFEVELPLHPHPLYNAGTSFSHDAMLIKLNRQSTKQFVRINDNNDLPSTASASVLNSLTTMGLGYTVFGDSKSFPTVLQEASLSYVPNKVCERAKDPNAKETYQGLISDDMLCASDDGEDACQGDSGGPLVIKRESPKDDVLVGIVSWGFGCAHEYFPGVFSRVSYFSDWIKMTICEVSSNPPPEFNCGNVVTLPSEENSVPVTVVLQLDDHPAEISWSIVRKETDTTLVNVLAGTYDTAQATTMETVFLPPGSNNYFKIFDAYGDGLCCDTPGNYRVVLGRDEEGDVLLSGGGDFGKERWHEFQVPKDFKDKTDKPNVQEGQIPLTVVIQLDGFPQEVGWRVDRLGVEIEEVIRIPAGIYVSPGMIVVRTVVLEEDELYYFSIYDMTEDGIERGKVQLFLGTTDIYDDSKLIFESDGDFQSGVDHTFLANGLGPAPTNPPLLPSQEYLTLELRMDLYPGEISVQLRVSDGDVAVGRQNNVSDTLIFFRPPGYYADRVSDTVLERIPIPQADPGTTLQFSFIISDLSKDGLCCSWSGSRDTGYSLFEGDPETGIMIANSKFESSEREVQIFTITEAGSNGGEVAVEETPEPSYEIKVVFSLDVYPDETGFYIEDSLKRRVVDVPPGTYVDQHSVVEEIVTLEAGLYTFTIVDSFGDGLNRADSFYRLELVGEEDRLPLLTGNGAFASQERHAFLVEGDAAKYPLIIRTPSGSEQKELGFDIVRLDLAESDATVASHWKGDDQEINDFMLYVTEGSLYRVVFETDSPGLDGDILINLGSMDPSIYKGMEYVVSPETMANSQRWQVKFLAGHLKTPPSSSFDTLTLQMKLDRFPGEVEWMLLSNDGDHGEDKSSTSRRQRKTTLLAYGPDTLYDQDMEGKVVTETITIPAYAGNHSFTLVVTDSGDDGTCCSYGQGGPVELFRGPVDDGHLILSEPFLTGRLAHTFFLMGTHSSATSFGASSFGVVTIVGTMAVAILVI